MIDPKTQNRSREEEASYCLNNTTFSQGTIAFLVVIFLLTISLELVLQSTNVSRSGRERSYSLRVTKLLPSFSRVRQADAGASGWIDTLAGVGEIKAFEDGLEENSVIGRTVLSPTQGVLSGLFGMGNEKAYCGRSGWLYYRPEVDHLIQGPFLTRYLATQGIPGTAARPDPVQAIADFDAQLKARGVRLIVMPAPMKPSIEPSELSLRNVRTDRPLTNPSYAAFIDALRKKGIAVFDANTVLFEAKRNTQRPMFLKTDIHWTPEGMDVVAGALAKYITDLNCLTGRTQREYMVRNMYVSGVGDVASMLRLPEDQRLYPPQRVSIRQVLNADGSTWQPDTGSEILLLGDSFINIYSFGKMNWGESAGFAEQLSFYLKQPIDVIARNAGGASATRFQLAREMNAGQDRLQGKRVLIYEFAMRELSGGDWKLLELPTGNKASRQPVSPKPSSPKTEPHPAGRDTAKAETGLKVTGRIKEISASPSPGSAPYKDCFVAIYLTGVKSESGEIPSEVLVYVWGLKDGRDMKTGELSAGESISLHLTPWEKVEKDYGGLNRVEVSDENALLLNAYYGGFVK